MRAKTTDRLIEWAYNERETVVRVRRKHDPAEDPQAYVRALISELRDGAARPAPPSRR